MVKVGVVTGLAFEAATLARAARRAGVADRVQVLCAGPGPACAGGAAERLIAEGVGLLLSAGLAGGLDPALAPGDAVLAETVIAPDGTRYRADAAALEAAVRTLAGDARTRTGLVAGVDAPVTSPAAKHRLHDASGALCVDMESHAVAMVAASEADVPFLALRVIADPAHQTIPTAALAGMRADGTMRPWPVVRAMLSAPHLVPDLMRLSRQSRAARRRLGRLGERLLPALAALRL